MSHHPPQKRPAVSPSDNSLKKATQLTKRVKLIVYGDHGAGKSALALQFPRTALIDLVGGDDLYGNESEFGIFSFATAGEPAFKVERTAKEG